MSTFAKTNEQNNLDDTALRLANLMRPICSDPTVSLHANRLFSGRAYSCKKTPVDNCFV